MGLEVVVLAAYTGCLALLLAFSLGQAHLGFLWRRSVCRPAGHIAPLRSLPTVTVQLPIYNERYVSRRVIDAVAAIDYPRDRFTVQVLDDSTDVTAKIVADSVAQWQSRGLAIEHVRRGTRDGYKAGALAHGLRLGTGEFVAIFDADFMPAPDVLRALLPYFSESKVGAVQACWGHLNERESALTRVEAFLLDMHFRFEQPARQAAGLFLNFNGTAGLWRRTAIEHAGGWSSRTVTEDIDLSYRAQLRGWRVLYIDAYTVPGELPADMAALRSQQHRWIKGGAQNARLHAAAVRATPDLGAEVRRHALHHLVAGSVYLVILAMLLLSVPLAALKGTTIHGNYADWGLPFAVATVALVWTFHLARRPRGIAGRVRFAVLMAGFMVFTLGLSVHNGLAALSGWVAAPGGEFVRTPKAGSTPWRRSAYAGLRVDRRVLPELAVLAWLVLGVLVGLSRGEHSLIPTQLLGIAGIGWIVTLSLWHPLRTRLTARTVPAAEPPEMTDLTAITTLPYPEEVAS